MSEALYNKMLSQYRKLDLEQARLFKLYGLRQIKYMIEEDVANLDPLPEGSRLVGLSTFGRITAVDEVERRRWSHFRNAEVGERWSEALQYTPTGVKELTFDSVEDFRVIYETLELHKKDKDDLTYLASNFLLVLERQIHVNEFTGGKINLTKDV